MSEPAGFYGIYPMLYAFFDAEDRLNRAAMRRQVDAYIAAGAHGIAVLGLGTEVAKLTLTERRTLLEWAAEDVGGRVPLAVTVAEASIPEQTAFVRAAAEAGAAFAILQPPPVRGLAEMDYVRFFGAVADRSPIPVAIQNAPDYIGVALSDRGIDALSRHHQNVRLVKAEGPALGVAQLIELIGGRMAVVNGRGGLELPDNLRAGCAGMIPSPDSVDVQVRIFELMRTRRSEDEGEAERLYREILPIVTFVMQSLNQFLCYGKRLTARRLGLGEVFDRAPAQGPTPFGLACLERHARALGPLD